MAPLGNLGFNITTEYPSDFFLAMTLWILIESLPNVDLNISKTDLKIKSASNKKFSTAENLEILKFTSRKLSHRILGIGNLTFLDLAALNTNLLTIFELNL
jgi:hypothetical protein